MTTASSRRSLWATCRPSFSIGLAMGVMVTYGSYVDQDRRLRRAAAAVAIGNSFFAVMGGLVIFPAVFSLGLDPAQGPALAFVVLPEVFAAIAGGGLIFVLGIPASLGFVLAQSVLRAQGRVREPGGRTAVAIAGQSAALDRLVA